MEIFYILNTKFNNTLETKTTIDLLSINLFYLIHLIKLVEFLRMQLK